MVSGLLPALRQPQLRALDLVLGGPQAQRLLGQEDYRLFLARQQSNRLVFTHDQAREGVLPGIKKLQRGLSLRDQRLQCRRLVLGELQTFFAYD